MLTEFSFCNFRSFKETALFSMEPTSQNGSEYNVIKTNLKRVSQLYRTSGIFGPNASGKSNIITAVRFFVYLLKNSSKSSIEDEFPAEWYALADGYNTKPVDFGIKFIVNSKMYDYKFSITPKTVVSETLSYYDISEKGSNRANLIFDRQYIDNKMFFKKTTGILQSWCNEILDNRLFLSDIVNNRKCILPEIQEAYNWITKKIALMDGEAISKRFSVNKILQGQGEAIVNLIKKADLGLDNITVRNVSQEEIVDMLNKSKEEIPPKIKQALISGDKKIFDVRSFHKSENGPLKEFDFSQMESNGTEKFLAITGPVLDVLENGNVLVVDEMDCALHPFLVKYIVEMFNDPEVNKNNAQLIFVSHAYYLMDGIHLTRDQIWLTDKLINNGYSSSLYSLSDFKDILKRKNISFYDAYMQGVYGAVPNVEKF